MVKEEDMDGAVIDDVDGVPLEELEAAARPFELGSESARAGGEGGAEARGKPMLSIVPYGDDLDGDPGNGK
jgi:hypothetical protein